MQMEIEMKMERDKGTQTVHIEFLMASGSHVSSFQAIVKGSFRSLSRGP